jgi:hypothetical protein
MTTLFKKLLLVFLTSLLSACGSKTETILSVLPSRDHKVVAEIIRTIVLIASRPGMRQALSIRPAAPGSNYAEMRQTMCGM